MGCDIHGTLEVKKYSWWRTEGYVPNERNYDWFGLLAEVRNYVNAIPISPLRGIPDELSDKTRDAIKEWNADGHSYSYLTWKDFKVYDWEQTFTDGRKSLMVKKSGEELYKAVMSNIPISDEHEERYLVRVAKDLISPAWKVFLDYMKGLANLYGSENVRIVFWFDN